jgi:hypothetical protein
LNLGGENLLIFRQDNSLLQINTNFLDFSINSRIFLIFFFEVFYKIFLSVQINICMSSSAPNFDRMIRVKVACERRPVGVGLCERHQLDHNIGGLRERNKKQEEKEKKQQTKQENGGQGPSLMRVFVNKYGEG